MHVPKKRFRAQKKDSQESSGSALPRPDAVVAGDNYLVWELGPCLHQLRVARLEEQDANVDLEDHREALPHLDHCARLVLPGPRQ